MNKELCKIYSQKLPYVFNNIGIPSYQIENNSIDNALKNSNIFPYLKDENIFNKYCETIANILSRKSILFRFLNEHTGNKSFILKVIADKKYSIISPAYIISFYAELLHRINDENKIKAYIYSNLDGIIMKFNSEKRTLLINYDKIMQDYVYLAPYELDDRADHIKETNTKLIDQLSIFFGKLLDLNIYAINEILCGMKYLPLEGIGDFNLNMVV